MSFTIQIKSDWRSTVVPIQFDFSFRSLLPSSEQMMNVLHKDKGAMFMKAVSEAISDKVFFLTLPDLTPPVRFIGYQERDVEHNDSYHIQGEGTIDITKVTDRQLLEDIEQKVYLHLREIVKQFVIMYYMVDAHREYEANEIQRKLREV